MKAHDAIRMTICGLAGYVLGLLIGGRVHPLVGLFGLLATAVLFIVTVVHEREQL